jgi:cytochrome P450
MSAIFMQNSALVFSRLKRQAAEKRPLDIQDLYFRYTLDSFAQIAFGESTGCLSDGAPLPFATAFDAVQKNVSQRFFDPMWVIKRFLNVGSERIIPIQVAIIKQYGAQIIQRVRQQRKVDRSEKPDLLSRFIDYAEANGESLCDEELLDVVLNFLIAGRDTTACLLSWATYELTQHAELQERLYDQVRLFNHDDDSHRIVSQMPLLRAFILETLRLHPSVPVDLKECVEADVWPAHSLPDGRQVVSALS